ncbi:MAG: LPS-assembly protein LptD [Gemmatimonadetes bacterium]|nr:LPS-assembly protein LptD [Gemmatimonadota bacterium]MYA64659.1 LPS-assembly protein LptD [Gemmatimonadota bacterium]MYB99381.1 LPS-assembly protein LptD [Gemmatimonadota bacterium]MYH51982.1 LPS-assembly protein LptD [Gemmatimonadota bacterium]MYI45538.1 LPS-assembly protein LptD [Gemmatimonadota bacterium]
MASRLRVRILPAVAVLIALAAAGGGHAPLSAQELPDSLKDVVKERLERLTRALGDSTGLLPDTLLPDPDEGVVVDDSTLVQLLALTGYNLIQYRSDNATFETESRVLTLVSAGGSETVMNRDGMELSADSALVFDDNTGRLVSVGSEATFTPEDGDPVLTRQVIFDLNEQRGTALDAQTQASVRAGSWMVRGDCPWVDGDLSYCHRMMFTSCDREEPHYHFQAGQMKLYPGGTMVARDVTLYFGDVGVFWLPFIAQSTAIERRSGFLPLQFSVNDIVRTSGGYARRVSNIGYYWAINEYADAQVALDWWSGNSIGLAGELHYNWARQFLQGGVNYRHFWRVEGGSELAINTDHRWELSERTRFRGSFAFASSNDFVRRNSFDPREVTQSIDSEGGFSRRFDWGTLSASANRQQFLSDDRVVSKFPSVDLSLNPITLFQAPPNRARLYNNMTWSARGSLSRSLRDLPAQNPDSAFDFRSADTEAWRGSFSSGLSLGALSISQSVNLNRNTTRDLPLDFFVPDTAAGVGVGSVGDLNRPSFFPHLAEDAMNFAAEELTWSTGVNYQVTLVGSTSLTPNLSISGRSIRSDTASVGGGGFIAAPRRLSFGASLKADLYGFYYSDRFRHKFSPTFDYAYSPETNPTDLQRATFGDRAIQPRNEVRLGLTQTFEKKVEDPAADSAGAQAAESRERDRSEGPRRLPRAQTVTVLAVRTSALTYDFVQASELGHFSRGFADNLRVSNQISSDYMRGLSLSVEHDIFDPAAGAGGGARGFAPFLSSANLSFSVSNQSTVFRWLRRLAGGEEEDDTASSTATTRTEEEDAEEELDPSGLETEDLGTSTVLPRSDDRRTSRRSSRRGGVGEWSASFTYSLARNRGVEMAGNQMVQANVRFQPTELWSVDWRTSYDVVAGAFNDHVVRLTRQMHRWEAEFAFQQTATGNWTFLFEVALTDNRDLHFDYEQRTGGDSSRRRPRGGRF